MDYEELLEQYPGQITLERDEFKEFLQQNRDCKEAVERLEKLLKQLPNDAPIREEIQAIINLLW